VRGNAFGSLAFLSLAIVLASCASCAKTEADIEKSQKWLDIAKDSLSKRQLEAAENEVNKAIAFNNANDEAYNIRGLISMVRAYETTRTLEVDACLTGVDAEATRVDLDKQLKKADDDFVAALKVTPDYGEAWSNRGVVHILLEDYGRAAELLTKALENPIRLVDPAVTRAGLGWAMFHQQKYVEAAKELRAVMQFKPKWCIATYRLGRVYFAREEWEKAAESFETASDDPSCGSQEASLYLMKTRMQQGLVSDARNARDACLKISAQSCIAAQCRADGGALGSSSGSP
jgi:tetratricopeptide (TPR) repeat protein